jgi:hypothetical protein
MNTPLRNHSMHLSILYTFRPQINWNEATQRFSVHDPDSPTAPLFLSPSELDFARKAFGTDEDLCLITWPPQRLLSKPQHNDDVKQAAPPSRQGWEQQQGKEGLQQQ